MFHRVIPLQAILDGNKRIYFRVKSYIISFPVYDYLDSLYQIRIAIGSQMNSEFIENIGACIQKFTVFGQLFSGRNAGNIISEHEQALFTRAS